MNEPETHIKEASFKLVCRCGEELETEWTSDNGWEESDAALQLAADESDWGGTLCPVCARQDALEAAADAAYDLFKDRKIEQERIKML